MLEAGAVRGKNALHVMFKNMLDICLGALVWWAVGYAFAFGGGAGVDGPFIGHTNFFLSNRGGDRGYEDWFFQFAFAASSATIVSGAVAERASVWMYFAFNIVMTGFVYPVVVHWAWDPDGWLTPYTADPIFGSSGFIDFAGSGVVHAVGGCAALMGAWVLGPRARRFEFDSEGRVVKVNDIPAHNTTYIGLGVFILWFGWYGFNTGSTLGIAEGISGNAAKVCVNSTIGAASGCVMAAVWSRVFGGKFDVFLIMNGALVGLVAITAGCCTVEPWGAFIIGCGSIPVFVGFSKLLLKVGIDDPLEASPMHMGGGIWGVLATGMFSTREGIKEAFNLDNDAVHSGLQFGTQLLGMVCIMAWTMSITFILFTVLKKTVGIRVEAQQEHAGLDAGLHEQTAYGRDIDDLGAGGINGMREPMMAATDDYDDASPYAGRISPARGKPGRY